MAAGLSSTSLGKYLCLILRHNPGKVGLTLDENGWAFVEELVKKTSISQSLLMHIVEKDTKNRYELNASRTKIRARQGHSLPVDLQLTAIQPPEVLYHGTSDLSVGSIFRLGLLKQSRQYVHLSETIETATAVGKRHGGAVFIFEVQAERMFDDGFKFYLSTNNVWLTDAVPAAYLIPMV
jgi:putative RNA 2'-phosphotransferase